VGASSAAVTGWRQQGASGAALARRRRSPFFSTVRGPSCMLRGRQGERGRVQAQKEAGMARADWRGVGLPIGATLAAGTRPRPPILEQEMCRHAAESTRPPPPSRASRGWDADPQWVALVAPHQDGVVGGLLVQVLRRYSRTAQGPGGTSRAGAEAAQAAGHAGVRAHAQAASRSWVGAAARGAPSASLWGGSARRRRHTWGYFSPKPTSQERPQSPST
jgi:hypothetical protein